MNGRTPSPDSESVGKLTFELGVPDDDLQTVPDDDVLHDDLPPGQLLGRPARAMRSVSFDVVDYNGREENGKRSASPQLHLDPSASTPSLADIGSPQASAELNLRRRSSRFGRRNLSGVIVPRLASKAEKDFTVATPEEFVSRYDWLLVRSIDRLIDWLIVSPIWLIEDSLFFSSSSFSFIVTVLMMKVWFFKKCRFGGTIVINKVLIANNGIAAVKCIRSIRRWSYEMFNNGLWNVFAPLRNFDSCDIVPRLSYIPACFIMF